MFTSNPFAEISAFIPPIVMQTYIVVMFLMVAGGTLFDMVHKKSATYFFRTWRKSKGNATRQINGGKMTSLAIQTVVVDVLTSGEFCRVPRRIAHLLSFYGFLAYITTTVIMVFAYPMPATPVPEILPQLWHIGAVMILVGGYWFWFFMRVDVAHEGHSPFRLVRADLFVVSLLLSVTFGVVWSIAQAVGSLFWNHLFLALYIFMNTVLFVSIPWSKFSHMFYKPAAAFQKRVEEANGSSNLPAPAPKTSRNPLGEI